MPNPPGRLQSWFAKSDPEMLEQRIQGLHSGLIRHIVLAVLTTIAISLLVMSRVSATALLAGGAAVLVLLIVRTGLLNRARHLTNNVPSALSRAEDLVALLTLACFSWLAWLTAGAPTLSGESQVALIGIAMLSPLAAVRTLGTSRLCFLAVAVPMFIGAGFALYRLIAPMPWPINAMIIVGALVAAYLIVEQSLRDLTTVVAEHRSRSRERSLLSQQLALFSTSQLGIAQTVENRLGRANGRFRQWFGEGNGDSLLDDLASTIGMSQERLTALITRADRRIRGHDSRTVHISLNGNTPRYFSVQVRRFDPNHPERGLLWTVSDQTSDWLRRQADERAATRDPLTGALNRRSLHKRISSMLARDLRRQPFGVLCVDINRFGDLNVANGEGFGDQILCIVTRRLQRMLREQDVIARTGGNEFVLVLENVNGMERATNIAEKVMETLSAPIVLTSMTCQIAAAVGVAVAPVHGRRTDEILGRARASMFAIKRTMVQVQAGKLGRRSK